MEWMRRIVRHRLGYQSWLYRAASATLDALSIIRKEGLRTWMTLRSLERAAQGSVASAGEIVLALKSLSHPIALRAGTRDVETVVSTVIREEYGAHVVDAKPRWLIDAGAYIGDTSAYFLSRFPTINVVALEPGRDTHGQAVKNLQPYDGRATVLHAGLWGSTGRLRFSGESTGAKVGGEGEEIDVVDIPTLMQRHRIERIDILKIDIEGAEGSVFSERPEAWLPFVGLLVIEIHGPDLEALIRTVLERHGFVMEQYRSVWYCSRKAS